MKKNWDHETFVVMHSKVFYSGESLDAENILNQIILENKESI